MSIKMIKENDIFKCIDSTSHIGLTNEESDLFDYCNRKHSEIKSRAKKQGYKEETLSRDIFLEWIMNHENIMTIYRNYIKSEKDIFMCPSVDRKNDYIGYTIENIELTNFKKNREKYNKQSRMDGSNTKQSSEVTILNEDGTVENFVSTRTAALALEMSSKNSIARAINENKEKIELLEKIDSLFLNFSKILKKTKIPFHKDDYEKLKKARESK